MSSVIQIIFPLAVRLFGMKECVNCGETETSENFLSFSLKENEFINPKIGEPTRILICLYCVDELGGRIETEYWIKDVFIKKTENVIKRF